MAYEVQFTYDAMHDLEEIYDYIERNDSPASANYVLDHIEEACLDLSMHPQRGNYPKELLAIGIRDCRQVLFKP